MFKPGDKVICIDDSNNTQIIQKGKVYEISSIYNSVMAVDVILHNSTISPSFSYKRFNLILDIDILKLEENIDHPSHYNQGKFEAIVVIEDWNLGFNLGNTVKYISRAGKKDPKKELEDLKKAAWYLNREIQNREKE